MALSAFGGSNRLCCWRASRNGGPGGGWNRLGEETLVIRGRFSQLPAQLIDLLLEVHHPQFAADRQPVEAGQLRIGPRQLRCPAPELFLDFSAARDVVQDPDEMRYRPAFGPDRGNRVFAVKEASIL